MSGDHGQDPLFKTAERDEVYASVNHVRQAWVVFSGQADLPWLKILKRGFRHCFVVLYDGVSWMTIDPMLHRMDVAIHHQLPSDFDLPRWLKSRGNIVVSAPLMPEIKRPAPAGVFTCVEAVKRVLGMRARLVVTPWQLYRYLNKYNSQKT